MPFLLRKCEKKSERFPRVGRYRLSCIIFRRILLLRIVALEEELAVLKEGDNYDNSGTYQAKKKQAY